MKDNITAAEAAHNTVRRELTSLRAAFSDNVTTTLAKAKADCPKCGSRLLRAPYLIVCENVMCDYDARRGQ